MPKSSVRALVRRVHVPLAAAAVAVPVVATTPAQAAPVASAAFDAHVQDIQRRLADVGMLPGSVDGVWGPRTSAAMYYPVLTRTGGYTGKCYPRNFFVIG